MSKHKTAGKEKDKGVQLVIRIAKSERTAFVDLCEALDTTAAREIRRFMREFVASKAPAAVAETPSAPAEPTAAEPVAEPVAEAATDLAEEAGTPKKTRKRVKA